MFGTKYGKRVEEEVKWAGRQLKGTFTDKTKLGPEKSEISPELDKFIKRFDRSFYKEMSFVIKHIDSLSKSRYDFETRMKDLNTFIEENCNKEIPTIYYT